MTEKLNTHYYDGCLKDQYRELVQVQNTKTNFLKEKWDINIVIREIHDNINNLPIISSIDKNNIVKVLKLLYTDRNTNYDSINDIDVLDILCRTWYCVRVLPIIDQIPFYIQLMEINNGKCSQGRTTRIFQICTTFF